MTRRPKKRAVFPAPAGVSDTDGCFRLLAAVFAGIACAGCRRDWTSVMLPQTHSGCFIWA